MSGASRCLRWFKEGIRNYAVPQSRWSATGSPKSAYLVNRPGKAMVFLLKSSIEPQT
jgi:hypothetical protein